MFISIITPVYNRSHLLQNLYKSILDQDIKYLNDIEWIIIDDGSQDNIDCIINNFIKENRIKIKYQKKENGGKHSAINLSIKYITGDYFMIVDSDDKFLPNGLEEIFKVNNYISIFKHGVSGDFTFKKNIYDINEFLKINVDTIFVFKKNLLENFSFPINKDENFTPEATVFNKLIDVYGVKSYNKTVVDGAYLSDGLSRQYKTIIKKNPEGILNLMATNLSLSVFSKSVIKQTAFHFSQIINTKTIIKLFSKNSKPKSFIIIIASIYVLIKKKFKK